VVDSHSAQSYYCGVERIISFECSTGIALARKTPRSAATPRWDWSGVEMLRTPPLADDKLARIVKLLPTQLLANEEVKAKILALGARYHRHLHQDEFGPTRAEQMSALRMLLGKLDQLDSLILELPQHLALDLTSNSEVRSWLILHGWSILRGWTIEQLHLAADLELSDQHAQHSADDLNVLERICKTAGATMELIQSLDTNSESELFNDALCTGLLFGKDTRDVDVFCIGAAPLDHLKRQFRLTIDRLQHRHDPEKQLSLPLLVWQLCDLWTDVTGRSVTNSAVRKGRYTSCPESPAGRFVLAIVEALQPSQPWITHNLRSDAPVRARPPPPRNLHRTPYRPNHVRQQPRQVQRGALQQASVNCLTSAAKKYANPYR
jgi:hypothetical protein